MLNLLTYSLLKLAYLACIRISICSIKVTVDSISE